MNDLVNEIFSTCNEASALQLLKKFNKEKQYEQAYQFGKTWMTWSQNKDFLKEMVITTYYAGHYVESFDIAERLIQTYELTEIEMKNLRFNAHFTVPHIEDEYISYPTTLPTSKNGPITFTITTCKRYDLFEKTMNSFLNCVKAVHLISRWICVDDNSSEEDRKKIKENYPFLEYYFKDESEKGHSQSMNMIRDLVKTPFWFDMEDDWKFFYADNFLTKCLNVLQNDTSLGQCLINRNYAETRFDHNILGGELKRTKNFQPYYLHVQRQVKGKSCEYWPHYSLRPSLLRTEILQLGKYNEDNPHFEMEYANRYKKKYKSAFLTGIYCLHTGRLCSERHSTKKNAYDLNNVNQFVKPLTVHVINLERRPDRWESFMKNNLRNVNVKRVNAVDGKTLKVNEQILRIFNENDYNWRRGIVGCALSHFKLYAGLLNSNEDRMVILEDDAKLINGFSERVTNLMNLNKTWDILYLGHYPKQPLPKTEPRIVQKNAEQSLDYSYGGTVGYVITKKGAEKLFAFIEKNGMTNAIDTIQQKSADDLEVWYSDPLCVSGEHYTGDKSGVDTDIQRDFDRLPVTRGMDRINGHGKFYESLGWEVEPCDCIDDDWKEESVLIIPKQEVVRDNVMMYTVDQSMFIVPDKLGITPEIIKQVQPYRFKTFDGGKFVYSINC